MGELNLTKELVDMSSSSELFDLERFVCKTYAPNGSTNLAELRWELFQLRNLEGEMLPPTLATIFPHIQRANFVTKRDKSYITPKPELPNIEDNGWNLNEDDEYQPIHCILPPAPTAVVELVKCGCKIKCTGRCSCQKNKLPCTALCKCYAWGCNSGLQKPSVTMEVSEEEDDEDELFT